MSALVLSLDFELHWGVAPRLTVEQYRTNLDGTRRAIERMLEVFEKNGLHCTWATVGFLFAKDKSDLEKICPDCRPTYENDSYNNYRLLPEIGQDEASDPYHYCRSMIEKIRAVPGQEIGTHTFSHYFCLEKGQTFAQFEADMSAAVEAAWRDGITFDSIVFPRNQYAEGHLKICNDLGINVFRGNPDHWAYTPRSRDEESLKVRATRFLDTYFNIAGPITHPFPTETEYGFNVPASRFLRPYSPKFAAFDGLRLRRITDEMTHAAHAGHLYHLWWHPHNFGKHTDENIRFLEKIVAHFCRLRDEHGMQSLNMAECAVRVTV